MTDWAKAQAEKFKARTHQNQLNDAVFLEQQRLLATLTPRRWADLRELFKKKCADFNMEVEHDVLRWEDVNSKLLRITRTDNRDMLEGTLDDSAHIVQFRCPSVKRHLWQAIIVGTDVQFTPLHQGAALMTAPTFSLEQISNEVLEDFLA